MIMNSTKLISRLLEKQKSSSQSTGTSTSAGGSAFEASAVTGNTHYRITAQQNVANYFKFNTQDTETYTVQFSSEVSLSEYKVLKGIGEVLGWTGNLCCIGNVTVTKNSLSISGYSGEVTIKFMNGYPDSRKVDFRVVGNVITEDLIVPSGNIVINNNESQTISNIVNIKIIGTDNIGVNAYILSESPTKPNQNSNSWVQIETTKNYLNDNISFKFDKIDQLGVFSKTVYVWFKDVGNNINDVSKDDINYIVNSNKFDEAKFDNLVFGE